MTPTIDSIIVDSLQALPEIERVYVVRGYGEGVRVLTVVDEEEDAVYERIYEKELQISDNLPSVLFDFSIIARRGQPIDLLMGQNAPIWVRPVPDCPQLISI